MLKAPFRPQVAGRIAFFLGPIAGAIVSVISLRRMGHPLRAKRIFLWTLLAAAILSVVITVTPDILGRVIGLGSELAFYLIFPGLQDREFTEWQTAHPELQPSNGWRALGWGLLGTLMFLVVFFAVAIPIAMIIPSAFAVAIPIALIFLSVV